jgi:sugar phosphate permease
MNTTTNRAITNWFPRHETGRTVGFAIAGQTFGNAISAPVVGLLAITVGWRPAFVIIAGIGLCWVVFWRIFATDYPAENRYVGKEEVRMVQESRASAVPVEKTKADAPLRVYLTRPSILAAGAALFAGNYTLYVFLNWLPSYFTEALHMDMKSMSILSFIPWICAAVGSIGGGMASDFLFRHMRNGVTARKLAVVVPHSVVALSLLTVSFVSRPNFAVALVALLLFCNTCGSSSIWVLQHDLVPARHLGGVGGYIHLLSNISGMIGPAITGVVLQYFGGYSSAFRLGAIICAFGVAAMIIFVKTGAKPTSLASGEAAV